MTSYIDGNIFIKEDSATSAPVIPAPTSTYQGCDCETCKELNVDCPDCPVCKEEEEGEEDSEVAMAMYDSQIGKSDGWLDSPFRISK